MFLKKIRQESLCIKGILVFVVLTTFAVAKGSESGKGKTMEHANTETIAQNTETDYASEFIKICDYLRDSYGRWDKRSYRESYAVRALNVAYDVTGDEKYLDVCKSWCDKMLEYQSRMNPKGAYYMGYGRKPGRSKGEWYVADSSCVAMGVLATAARCTDTEEEQRNKYMDSVKGFADLTIERFARDSGGITDGYWRKSKDEWWCSTALFASLTFLLYEQTREEKYKKVAEEATDWLLRFDYRKATTPHFDKQGAPTVIFYMLEPLAAGMPHFKGERRRKALEKFGEYIDWVVKNVESDLSIYKGNWGSKIGGLPFHLAVYARIAPQEDHERAEVAEKTAKRILAYLSEASKSFFQRTCFASMSFCEKAYPDTVYHRKQGRIFGSKEEYGDSEQFRNQGNIMFHYYDVQPGPDSPYDTTSVPEPGYSLPPFPSIPRALTFIFHLTIQP